MVTGAVHGAVDGWRGSSPAVDDWQRTQASYLEKWSLYDGSLFSSTLDRSPYRNDASIYRNTKLLWKHVEAIVDFYAGVIYQGALAAEPPKEGSNLGGAIPLVAQAPGRDGLLLKAIVELFIAWNWQQQMSLRPLYGSCLGDVLTEIVDDTERGFVYPQIVWPGHVTEIELDYVGNVQRYALEYTASEVVDGKEVSYPFRKEVDKESFRYFKDDKPYDIYGPGTAVTKNPYGFVPAIWDRHRVGAPGDVRGRSAIDGTRQALLHVNSVLSHAFDFQRKAFFMPPMVGGNWKSQRGANDKVDVTAEDNNHAQETGFLKVPADATLLQQNFDIGKTREMLEDTRQGILDENPEARFYQQLRDMAQVTAPAAERLMGDVKTRVDLARAGYDSNTVKLFQMSIAICGMRASDGTWNRRGQGLNVKLSSRQQAFLPFNLDSYAHGDLDMSISQRPIVPMSESERLDLIAQKEALMTPWGLEQAGVGEEAARKILDSRTLADAGIM